MKNKSKISAIVIVLVLTFATMFVALPIVSAHTPTWTIPTYTYVSVAPNPTGVGQSVTVTIWLDKVPPTADGAYGDRWEDITVDVTKPDGSKETLGPYKSDPVGSVWTQYTPNQVGEYQFQGIFPGQVLAGNNPPPWGYGPISLGNPAFINDTYLASTSDIVTLTVQEDPIQEWQSAPLPTEFWTRPIYGENREWSSIASDWFAGSANHNSFQPYGTAPNSAHVMWSKPLTWGGVVGEYGAIPYYEGLSYESYFGPPIIIDGRLYYNTPTPPMYGFKCVDLYTG